MTIVNLYKRYKRWNPVHPTCGAFWGIGVGLGCGVGWGPGFGPEVIGYTGAGCGVGFSVGVTLVGCGVGLPASGLTCLPCDTMVLASGCLLDVTKARVLPAMLVAARQSWASLTHQAASLEERLRVEHAHLLTNVRFPPAKMPFLHLWLRRHYSRKSVLLQGGGARKATPSSAVEQEQEQEQAAAEEFHLPPRNPVSCPSSALFSSSLPSSPRDAADATPQTPRSPP